MGQLLVLALIVAVIWLGSKLKKQRHRIEKLEDGKEEDFSDSE